MVMVRIVFRVRAQFPFSIQWRCLGRNISERLALSFHCMSF